MLTRFLLALGPFLFAVAGGTISAIWPLEEATSRITVYGLP